MKYELPQFLSDMITQETYEHWLRRKAQAHIKRDRRRGNLAATGESYRNAIHSAVRESQGCDVYTGEKLDWSIVSQYDNDESQEKGRQYKRQFALLPTVDHVGDGTGPANFKIFSWRTNDAKNDLELSEFLALCRVGLENHNFVVKQQG